MLSFYIPYIKGLLNVIKKILIVSLALGVVFFLFIHFAFGATQPKKTSNMQEFRANIYSLLRDPQNAKTKQGQAGVFLLRTISCRTIGEACTNNPTDGDKNFSHSFFGFVASVVSFPYSSPPASGVEWAYSGIQQAGFVPKTYAAQGIGYGALAPFKGIWLMFRNLVFLLMVLIIVIIGFMIMFRAKINPQTVISVENALPRIVIALLLITFSYAIAGFLIDLMYISVGFIITLFATTPNFPIDPKQLYSSVFFKQDNSIFEILFPFKAGEFVLQASQGLYSLLPELLKNVVGGIGAFLIEKIGFIILGKLIPGMSGLSFVGFLNKFGVEVKESGTQIASIIGAAIVIIIDFLFFQWAGQFLAIAIIFVLILFSILFLFFRIFFMLLSVYINTILLIVFSPLIIAFEAVPGRSTFAPWLKNLVLNLATFPLLVAFTCIVQIVMNSSTTSGIFWRPPYLYGIDPSSFRILIAGGMLFAIPELIKTIKEMTGVKPLPINIGLGGFFGGGQAAAGGAMGLVGQIGTLNLGLAALSGGLGDSFKRMLGGPGGETKQQTADAASKTNPSLNAAAGAVTEKPPGT